jgi:cyanophycin synthetase
MRYIAGPNIYSYAPVCVMKLYLDDLAETSSAQLPGFTERLLAILPGLQEHGCSERHPGGFVERLHAGTYLGHIVEHIAIELSGAAGIPITMGKTRYTGESTAYNIIVECPNKAGMTALLETAVGLAEAVIKNEPFPFQEKLEIARRVIAATALGPSTRAIVEAAQRRGIPCQRLNDQSFVQLGYGKHRKLIEAAMGDSTSAVAVEIASDKQVTKTILERASIPVPRGRCVKTEEAAIKAWREIGGAVVVKPRDSSQGKGVSLNLNSADEIRTAFQLAREFSADILVEELFTGKNYRVLVIGGKMAAVSERVPACVSGDGVHTIAQLIDLENQNPLRGEEHTQPLTRLNVDAIVLANLSKRGLTPASIPAQNEIVILRESANLSTGGTAIDVTDRVHPATRQICERAARLIGLNICGIDLMARDIAQPLEPGNGVLEMNASPGLRMHLYPSAGQLRPVADAIVDVLFPPGTPSRIPLIAITGTNGKTTVTRMIAHIFSQTGKIVGMTSTDGVFIDGQAVTHGDDTGPRSARIVLSDPLVEVAVLETARGGIARSGLAYDWSDVGVITNIQADHIGVDNIKSVDDIAFIKSLIAERVRENGTLVLNADDANVIRMSEAPRVRNIKRHLVYFTLSVNHPRVQKLRAAGATVYFEKDGWLIEQRGWHENRIMLAAEIPATMNGAARFNIANALAAIAACRAQGISREQIALALAQFCGEACNPGRANLYRVGAGTVMLDYGHNAHAFQAVAQMATAQRHRRVTGVITVPGDRADWLIEEAGRVAARSFTRLIVREDQDLRGRQPGEIAALLARAIKSENPACECQIILGEAESYRHALQTMAAEELVILFFEKFENARRILDEFGAVPIESTKAYTVALPRTLALAN